MFTCLGRRDAVRCAREGLPRRVSQLNQLTHTHTRIEKSRQPHLYTFGTNTDTPFELWRCIRRKLCAKFAAHSNQPENPSKYRIHICIHYSCCGRARTYARISGWAGVGVSVWLGVDWANITLPPPSARLPSL